MINLHKLSSWGYAIAIDHVFHNSSIARTYTEQIMLFHLFCSVLSTIYRIISGWDVAVKVESESDFASAKTEVSEKVLFEVNEPHDCMCCG